MPSDTLGKLTTCYQRSPFFYWEYVVFRAENTLYRVPKHVLENFSSVFSSVYSLPQPDADPTTVAGLSDENPIILDGIESRRFDALLTVLLLDTRYFTYEQAKLGKEEWLWILELANEWQFVNIRFLAIAQLSDSKLKIPGVDRIVFGQQFAVADWVVSGLRDVASSNVAVTPEDVKRLGVDVCLALWQIQLTIRPPADRSYLSLEYLLHERFDSMVIEIYEKGLTLGDLERPEGQQPGFY